MSDDILNTAIYIQPFRHPDVAASETLPATTEKSASQGKSHAKPTVKTQAHAPKNKSKHGFTPAHRHPPSALRNLQKHKLHSAPQNGAPKWLQQANDPAQSGYANSGVKKEVQAVQNYLAVARHGKSAELKKGAMAQAGMAMRRLEVMGGKNKLTRHDREAIAATKRIYNNYQKLSWGQTKEDPDIRLIKMSHERHHKNHPKKSSSQVA